jgi:flagellar hook assembly protein FlgD
VTIRFDLPAPGEASLVVFDVTGRRVRTIVSGRLDAGRYAPVWDGRDDAGSRVAAGVYFVRLQAADFTATRKSVRLK